MMQNLYAENVMQRHKTVDDYVDNAESWQDELNKLRSILNTTSLDETVKWGGPCYTHNGKNVVGLGAFKSYVGLWFYQGALLEDTDGVLINAQSGKTRALRQWRFKSMKDIKVRAIKAYVAEAVALAAAGKEIKPDRGKPVTLPEELKSALAKKKRTAAAYEKLTKGRQREYADYIAGAKRADTKAKRLAKVLPMIAAGKGLNDKYR